MKRILVFVIFFNLNGILISGQSIAGNDKCAIKKTITWHKLFKFRVEETYNTKCEILKVSRGHNSSWFKHYKYDFTDSIVSSNSLTEIRIHNSQGTLIKMKLLDRSLSTVVEHLYEYDSLNRLYKINILSNDKKVVTYYYQNDNIFPSSEVASINNQIVEETKYDRDSIGNPINITQFFFKNGVKYIETRFVGGFDCSPCRYTYDKKGNWRKKYLKLSNGMEKLYAVRRIVYF
jgi:hypothetical protein